MHDTLIPAAEGHQPARPATAAQLQAALLEAISVRDFDALEGLYHRDYAYRGPDGRERAGAAAAVEVIRAMTAAFPDFDVRAERRHEAGAGLVVGELRATGTHLGELDGLPATGRRVEFVVCNVLEAREGRIAAEREYWDNAAIAAQLATGSPQG